MPGGLTSRSRSSLRSPAAVRKLRSLLLPSVRITKRLMLAVFANRERSERKKIFPVPRGPEKLKVHCLIVTVKIMFKWCNNVVATNVAD